MIGQPCEMPPRRGGSRNLAPPFSLFDELRLCTRYCIPKPVQVGVKYHPLTPARAAKSSFPFFFFLPYDRDRLHYQSSPPTPSLAHPRPLSQAVVDLGDLTQASLPPHQRRQLTSSSSSPHPLVYLVLDEFYTVVPNCAILLSYSPIRSINPELANRNHLCLRCPAAAIPQLLQVATALIHTTCTVTINPERLTAILSKCRTCLETTLLLPLWASPSTSRRWAPLCNSSLPWVPSSWTR